MATVKLPNCQSVPWNFSLFTNLTNQTRENWWRSVNHAFDWSVCFKQLEIDCSNNNMLQYMCCWQCSYTCLHSKQNNESDIIFWTENSSIPYMDMTFLSIVITFAKSLAVFRSWECRADSWKGSHRVSAASLSAFFPIWLMYTVI